MLSLRERLEKKLVQLRDVRITWEPAWRDICNQMIPYRAVWASDQDRGRGDKKEGRIINNTPVRALNTLAAGMMAGITSPARQWFDLTIADRDLAKSKKVKQYLNDSRRRIEAMFQTSNWYNALSNGVYLDLGAIGTSCMFEEETTPGLELRGDELHLKPQIHFRPLPIGEYYLDIDHNGEVDTCFRELTLTVRQIVKKFGIDKVSAELKRQYDMGNTHVSHTVIHAIYPNDEYREGRIGHAGKKFKSCWWERNGRDKNSFLRVGGYDDFPVLAPRWFTRPGDVYGRGPGWEVRGDCRSLQHMERKILQITDKIVSPPMIATGNIQRMSLLPGDITHIPKGTEFRFEPAMTISPQALDAATAHVTRHERRIDEAMYVHLWQSLISDSRNMRPTATEVEAKRQEVMLMLGPLLENLDNGLLEPAVERTYQILQKRGALPEPPEELEGHELQVGFISIMHQMQKATGLSSLRTFVGEISQFAQAKPEALDKIDADAVVNEYARITGVPPDVVRSDKEVDEDRKAQAEAAQAKEQGEAMLSATEGARNLGQTDPQNLSQIAGAISPVAAAQGGALPRVLQ